MTPTRLLIALAAAACFAVAPAALAATPSPVKRSASYSGPTSQGSVCRVNGEEGRPCTMVFKTSKDRKKVTSALFRWRAGPCSDDPNRYYRGATDAFNLKITNGRFKLTVTYQDKSFGDETKVTNQLKLNGKFKRSSSGKYTASGSFSIVADITFADGTKSHCETGPVTWTAKPK